MSERKVLNKYYPPDFDPNKIPRLHLSKDRQYTVRLMAPFNMRCKTCGEYIYKGKKFNARKETVQGEDYLGLKIFRFYIKCTRCVAEITFKTDPKNTDYVIEHGATRNFQAAKLAEEEAIREQKEKEEDELNNPMKVLENRTKDSKYEMDLIEKLEELKELNMRHAQINHDQMLQAHTELEEQMRIKQEQEDEQFIQSVFPKTAGGVFVKRLHDSDDDDEEQFFPKKIVAAAAHTVTKASDILLQEPSQSSKTKSLLKTFGPLIRPKSSKIKVNSNQSSEKPKSVNGLSLLGAYDDGDSSE